MGTVDLSPIELGIVIAAAVIGFFIGKSRSSAIQTSSLPHISQSAPPSDDSIRELLRSGKKIEAIKMYREKYNCGLKEAKEAVEKL